MLYYDAVTTVRIISCHDRNHWYYNMVGELVDVKLRNDKIYDTIENSSLPVNVLGRGRGIWITDTESANQEPLAL